MSEGESTPPERPKPTVFLSYASEDREAARLVRDALPALGLEPWHDESELVGGDAWDQKIRRQIRECDFFMPIISARTEARLEGYFRREWRLAVERTLDMADDHIFLLPIVIDETTDSAARVPDRFRSVQWTRLPSGQPTPAFEALCRRLASGDVHALPPPPPKPSSSDRGSRRRYRPPPPPMPVFPKYDAQQKRVFAGHVGLWAGKSLWALFMRLPSVVRIIAYIWIAGIVLQRGCAIISPEKEQERLSAAQSQKLKEIVSGYQRGQHGPPDLANLATEIAKNFPAEPGAVSAGSALLAVPFSAPPGDAAAKALAESAFAQTYGRVAISHRGKVSLPDGAQPSEDMASALEHGRQQHAKYVLYGAVETAAGASILNVKIIEVADGSVPWSGTYPVATADAAKIAADVDAKVPDLDED